MHYNEFSSYCTICKYDLCNECKTSHIVQKHKVIKQILKESLELKIQLKKQLKALRDKNLIDNDTISKNLKLTKHKPTNPPIKGYYVSDDFVIDQIIDTMEKESANMFYFATTLQSHMPYTKEKYERYQYFTICFKK